MWAVFQIHHEEDSLTIPFCFQQRRFLVNLVTARVISDQNPTTRRGTWRVCWHRTARYKRRRYSGQWAESWKTSVSESLLPVFSLIQIQYNIMQMICLKKNGEWVKPLLQFMGGKLNDVAAWHLPDPAQWPCLSVFVLTLCANSYPICLYCLLKPGQIAMPLQPF